MDNTAAPYINSLAFEIKDEKDYQLAISISPTLAEIPFEAVHGHFFGLTGTLSECTIPPGALSDHDITIVSGEFNKVKIVRFTRD